MKTASYGKSNIEVFADFDAAPAGMAVLVAVKSGKYDEDNYWVELIPSDWGQAFRFVRHGKFSRKLEWVEPETYEVLVEDSGASCSCKGHARWGHCKHAKVAVLLIEAGAEPK